MYYRIDFVTYEDRATCQGKICTYVNLGDGLGKIGNVCNTNGTVEEFNEVFSKYKAELIEQDIFAFAKTTYSENEEGIYSIYCDIYVEPKKGSEH